MALIGTTTGYASIGSADTGPITDLQSPVSLSGGSLQPLYDLAQSLGQSFGSGAGQAAGQQIQQTSSSLTSAVLPLLLIGGAILIVAMALR